MADGGAAAFHAMKLLTERHSSTFFGERALGLGAVLVPSEAREEGDSTPRGSFTAILAVRGVDGPPSEVAADPPRPLKGADDDTLDMLDILTALVKLGATLPVGEATPPPDDAPEIWDSSLAR